jgi:hypothetical protein
MLLQFLKGFLACAIVSAGYKSASGGSMIGLTAIALGVILFSHAAVRALTLFFDAFEPHD